MIAVRSVEEIERGVLDHLSEGFYFRGVPLVRRAAYGGRKGRSAGRRLRSKHPRVGSMMRVIARSLAVALHEFESDVAAMATRIDPGR